MEPSGYSLFRVTMVSLFDHSLSQVSHSQDRGHVGSAVDKTSCKARNDNGSTF
jgi:hypothetical protein